MRYVGQECSRRVKSAANESYKPARAAIPSTIVMKVAAKENKGKEMI